MNTNLKFDGAKPYINRDDRDYNIAQFIPGQDIITDEEFCLPLPELNIILNQTIYNACVGHSYATCKSILEYIRCNKWIDIDPFMIYGTRANNEYIGEGMYSWQGAKVLLKEGAYLRRDFNKQEEMPQLKETVDTWKKANPEKVKEALNLKISGYSYVKTTNQFKTALKNKMPISVTYPVYQSLYEVSESGLLKLPNKNDDILGYHQMTVVGWTKNKEWIVINSWGVNYGLKGMYLIPFDYPFDNAIAVSDTISPIKKKAQTIELSIGKAKYRVDDSVSEFDSVPFIKNDRTYIPIRFISEALGASVEWVPETRRVIIRSEEAIIEMQINNRKMKINNYEVINDAAPIIVNDRTMLPIRVIAENLNCKVDWNNDNLSVKIQAL